jgi:uncharacterized membrane protein YfhO
VGTDAPFGVFEYESAEPPYGFVDRSVGGSVEASVWSAERREFMVSSDSGGVFALHEQFLPGWQATVDGESVPMERWSGAFQSVRVMPGRHVVQFRYRSRSLELGAGISFLMLLSLGAMFLFRPREAAAR